MSRSLLCAQCGAKWKVGTYQVMEASAEGPAEWARVVRGPARLPQLEDRVMRVNGEPIPLNPDQFDCDMCATAVRPGDDAVCVTFWAAGQRTPPEWEGDYLQAAQSFDDALANHLKPNGMGARR